MLKKSDLSKQFELVVQQEIKNYQDSLNFMLQSIRELKESIDQIRSESLENYALIHSQNISLENQLQGLRESYSNSQKKFQSHVNDFEFFKQKATDEISMHGYRSIENSRKNEFNENQIHQTNGVLETIENKMRGYSLDISVALENARVNLKSDLKKLKEEILSIPSDSIQLKKDLEEKLDSHKIDVSGVMREISALKKNQFVTQKMIENIYTLIERLKKLEVTP